MTQFAFFVQNIDENRLTCSPYLCNDLWGQDKLFKVFDCNRNYVINWAVCKIRTSECARFCCCGPSDICLLLKLSTALKCLTDLSRLHLILAPPKVQVYSRNPGEFGQKNVLICHVSGFHPPDITIQLMKGEVELKDANQTDLAFKEDWHFHLTKSVFFTPQHEEAYICKVTHGNKVSKYTWGELRKGHMYICNKLLFYLGFI